MGRLECVLLLLKLLTPAVLSAVEAATCKAPSSPECHLMLNKDVNCSWRAADTTQPASYELFAMAEVDTLFKLYTGSSTQTIVPEEDVFTSVPVDFWVNVIYDNSSCSSTKTSVLLSKSVKYSAPIVTKMSWSLGNLSLSWHREEEHEIVHEICFRTRHSQRWQKKSFETPHSREKLDVYTLELFEQEVYEVKLRRQAKGMIPWSDWSPITLVPLQIQHAPKVNWTETRNHSSRTVLLSWEPPPGGESLGSVWYSLSVYDWPCGTKPRTIRRNSTFYSMEVTLSQSRLNISAENRIGRGPPHTLIIPPVPPQKSCQRHFSLKELRVREACLEWYRLADGQTRPDTVNKMPSKSLSKVNDEAFVWQAFDDKMEDYVRYYYFVHGKRKTPYTKVMCPIYKTEGAPTAAPSRLTMGNITHNSAVVHWEAIPVEEQRGFVHSYVIWLSGPKHRARYQVPATETSFAFHSLSMKSTYTVHIAGETESGLGPNTTKLFITTMNPAESSSKGSSIILTVCVLAVLILIFSILARKLKSKLFPTIPSPVISDTANYCPDNQEDPKEEVHEVVVLLPPPLHSPCPAQKLSTLLPDKHPSHTKELIDHDHDKGDDEEDDEGYDDPDEEKRAEPGVSTFRCPGNTAYKRQLLQLSEFVEKCAVKQEEKVCEADDTSSTYGNGLLFEVKI